MYTTNIWIANVDTFEVIIKEIMKKIFKITLSVVAGLFVPGLLGFLYWGYAPTPEEPKLSAGIEKSTIQAGDYERTYLSYVPKSLVKNSKPGLIIVLHGSGIDGEKIREWTGYEFDQMADENGFIVLYPDGYKNHWNDLRKIASFEAKKKNIDDVGFINSLIKKYESVYGVDPLKVYAFGYSNGGEMAFRIAIEQPQLFAAITSIGSCLPTADNRIASIGNTLPRIMMVNGTEDPIVPFDGGKIFLFGQDLGKVISAKATAEIFAQSSQATKVNDITRFPHQNVVDLTTVDKEVWMHAGQPVVELFTINGGGHVIPQQKAKFPRFMGNVSRDLDAPREAVRFFGLGRE